jgi:hypothetical protein
LYETNALLAQGRMKIGVKNKKLLRMEKLNVHAQQTDRQNTIAHILPELVYDILVKK